MRKLIFGLALLTFAVSCKKDEKKDDIPQSTNNLATYNGNTYATPNGLIEDFGDNDTISHDWDISFGNLTLAELASENLNKQGVNNVYLDLNGSFGSTSLEAGTYNFVSESESEDRPAFSLVYGAAYLNANIVDGFPAGVGEGGIATESLSGGSVVVAKDGNTYTITYDLEFSGVSVSGNYKGTLESLDGLVVNNTLSKKNAVH